MHIAKSIGRSAELFIWPARGFPEKGKIGNSHEMSLRYASLSNIGEEEPSFTSHFWASVSSKPKSEKMFTAYCFEDISSMFSERVLSSNFR